MFDYCKMSPTSTGELFSIYWLVLFCSTWFTVFVVFVTVSVTTLLVSGATFGGVLTELKSFSRVFVGDEGEMGEVGVGVDLIILISGLLFGGVIVVEGETMLGDGELCEGSDWLSCCLYLTKSGSLTTRLSR